MPDEEPGEAVHQQHGEHGVDCEAVNAPDLPESPSPAAAQSVSGHEERSEIQSLKDELRTAEKWMIWLTGAIAFFGLCTVVVGILQWLVMGGQLREIRSGSVDTHALAVSAGKQADATNTLAREAKRSTDIAQLQQVPWLGIEQPGTMQIRFAYVWPEQSPVPYPTINLDVRFSAKNYGPSPAYFLPWRGHCHIPA
jgi:hypothetical protein